MMKNGVHPLYTFDTATAVERLKLAGAEPDLAQAIVSLVAEAQDGLVTRADLRAQLATLETTLVKWMVLTALGTAGLLFAALRLTA